MEKRPSDRPFVACGSCRDRWPSWDEFVIDPAVRLLGLQAVLTVPDANLLVFEHGCGSSVSVLAKRIRHLLPPHVGEPLPSLRGTEHCPGHCLSLADLEACDRPCTNARDRDLIRIVQEIQQARPAPTVRASTAWPGRGPSS
jgi:hypothetical protein